MLKKIFFSFIIFTVLANAQTFTQFKAQQNKAINTKIKQFNRYKHAEQLSFQKYRQAQLKVFNIYKKQIAKFWVNPTLSTKKTWLSYTPDKLTQTNVNFKNETITIKTIAKSKKEAKLRLKNALARVITINNAQINKTDPLQIKLSKIKKPTNLLISPASTKPILSTVIFNKTPTKQMIKKYVKIHIFNHIKITKAQKVTNSFIYSVKVTLPPDAMLKRAKLYLDKIKRYGVKEQIGISLILAIIQTESSFNPRARSYVPAYGLMQIVPTSAGMDAYNYLYNQQKLVSSWYLYNSSNNIQLGSAYLHLLYYKYLSDIKNPHSRLYCTIAAYNTGAGNVAWVFTKTYNPHEAARVINQLTPKEVYNTLYYHLKYKQTRDYLKNVSRRMLAYNKLMLDNSQSLQTQNK